MAFGVPLVPEENKIVRGSLGSQETEGKSSSSSAVLKKSVQERSWERNWAIRSSAAGRTMVFGPLILVSLSYNGSTLPPRIIWSWQKTSSTLVISRRVSISFGEKLSGM